MNDKNFSKELKKKVWGAVLITIFSCSAVFLIILSATRSDKELRAFIKVEDKLLWGAEENKKNLEWFISIDIKTIPTELQRGWTLYGLFLKGTLEKRTIEIFQKYIGQGEFFSDRLTVTDISGGVWEVDYKKGGLTKIGQVAPLVLNTPVPVVTIEATKIPKQAKNLTGTAKAN